MDETKQEFNCKRYSADSAIVRLVAAGIVFTQRSKNGFFAPQGRHVAPINVKFCTGEWPYQISRLSEQKCGNTDPTTVKILNFGHKLASQGSLVCTIFTKVSTFVRVSR